ncbi:MAG: FAD-binding oxidoreductase [Balneolaceae bacterium]|nr:FAD-binding oxidoreductase [Balneolaceae bacterium]
MKKTVSGWGRYPVMEAEVRELLPGSTPALPEEGVIARGLGRSYGDSALAETMYQTLPRNRMLDFDRERGELHCEAGVSFAELLRVFVPRGWFPPVTAGTKHITVGGAIASDVHGKNHHRDGCFSDYVRELTLLGPGGEIFVCSRKENPELFHATCGGMGLTGIILEARMQDEADRELKTGC